jgi:hypothetical protein
VDLSSDYATAQYSPKPPIMRCGFSNCYLDYRGCTLYCQTFNRVLRVLSLSPQITNSIPNWYLPDWTAPLNEACYILPPVVEISGGQAVKCLIRLQRAGFRKRRIGWPLHCSAGIFLVFCFTGDVWGNQSTYLQVVINVRRVQIRSEIRVA